MIREERRETRGEEEKLKSRISEPKGGILFLKNKYDEALLF